MQTITPEKARFERIHAAQRIAYCAGIYAMRRKAHELSTYFCNVG